MKLRTQDAVVGAAVVLVQVLGVLSLPTDWRDLRTWQSAGFVAAAAVLFTGPLIAAWAAWHEARRRRASDLVTVAVRARAAVLFAWHAPIGLTIVALSLLSTLSIVFLSRGPVSGTSLLGSLALAPVIAAGCGALGMSLGRFLSPVLGSPAALLGAYLILALPSSLSPFALRHIVGFHLDCCFLSSEPALPAVVAPILWWSLITAAVLAVLCLPDHSRFTRTLPAIAAVGAMATGGLILSPVVAHLESFPQQPRAAALLSCRPTSLGASGPEVCLWPESEALRPGAAEAVAIVTQQLRSVGVNPPPVASEGVGASWLISAHSQPELMLWNATLGLVLREAPRCSQTQEWRMGEQAEILAAWVGLTVGLEDERLQTNFQSDILLDAQDQRRRPIAEQSAWFTENLRRLDQSVATDDCTIGPAA